MSHSFNTLSTLVDRASLLGMGDFGAILLLEEDLLILEIMQKEKIIVKSARILLPQSIMCYLQSRFGTD